MGKEQARWSLILTAAVIIGARAALVADVSSQPEALSLLEDSSVAAAAGEADVLDALDRGWFDLAKRVLRLLRERGEAVATLAEVRARATQIRDQATEVINLMRTGANAEATDVKCAFQWAQRPEYVYLNVKFSSRIDGPVTVLNVDDERVSLTNESLVFEAMGRQKPKQFRLNLTFYGEIDAERSSWSFASVGRMSFTIAKVVNETWPRLLRGKERPRNMYAWHERQSVLDAAVKAEAKARKDAKAQQEEVTTTGVKASSGEHADAAKAAAAQASAVGNSGTVPRAPQSAPSSRPASDAAMKKKRKKRSTKKEEL